MVFFILILFISCLGFKLNILIKFLYFYGHRMMFLETLNLINLRCFPLNLIKLYYRLREFNIQKIYNKNIKVSLLAIMGNQNNHVVLQSVEM